MERGKISFNHNANGSISVKIELSGGTVWVTKSEIANLLEVFTPAISANLREIFKSKELFETEVSCYHNDTMFYNLDVIIALAFRCKSPICRRFREWLREQAKRPIVENPKQSIIIYVENYSKIN